MRSLQLRLETSEKPFRSPVNGVFGATFCRKGGFSLLAETKALLYISKHCCRVVPLTQRGIRQVTLLTVTSQGASFLFCFEHFVTLSEK